MLVILVGTLFLLTGAFHGALWFDESYSVAIARLPYRQIWSVGSFDVHPVLYYWGLHTLYLVFGAHLVIYRVFTICGTVSLGLLGVTHIRRDYGMRAGVLFSFIVLFLPYFSYMSIQIRMYSWATFAVMLTWIYALRIGRAERCPARYWVTFALASLASAYLHYYALLSVFIINVCLLIYLVTRHATRRRDLTVFFVQAVLQVAVYCPWIFVLVSQLGVVSDDYWVRFTVSTLIELLRYPVVTMQLGFALGGNYGSDITLLSSLLVSCLVLWMCWLVAHLVRQARARRASAPSTASGEVSDAAEQGVHADVSTSSTAQVHPAVRARRCWSYITREDNLPAFLGLGLYVALVLVATLASVVMQRLMVYYRYLSIGLGPAALFVVWLVLKADSRTIVKAGSAIYLAIALLGQGLMISDDYSPLNSAPFDYLAQNMQEGDVLVSSDIGFVGQTSLEFPDTDQCYLDWQNSKSWGRAYDVYSPPLHDIYSWQEVLDSGVDRIWMLGTSSDATSPRDLQDMLKTKNVVDDGTHEMTQYETFYRPYERTYYTVALVERAGGE